MERAAKKQGKAEPKYFQLPEIVRMKPYLDCLMGSLRRERLRQQEQARILSRPLDLGHDDYAVRRRRHDAQDEVAASRVAERQVFEEFRSLGVRVGNVERGEILFPCLINIQRAYFIWFVEDARPTHWRYQGDSEVHVIPNRWFSDNGGNPPEPRAGRSERRRG